MTTLRLGTLLPILLAGAVCAFAGAQTDATPAELPVTQLVLFTNGIGYFEHAGEVDGTQELELRVGDADMDDLLQSLVVQDLDGGTIRPVRYGARDPLERILDGFEIDLRGNPTLAELLTQARGERVRVDADGTTRGTIVAVERVVGPEGGVRTHLTLVSPEGLKRVWLDEVRELRFEDPALRAELDAALAAIARNRDDDDAVLRLRFAGEGVRRVRVGYVREMPVWKTSYRLVTAADGTAELQGWAIVDNPTDLDLHDVRIAFVAGQPISFVTELFEPVYVERPRLPVAVGPTVVPEADAGALPPAAMPRAARAPAAAMAEAAADEAAEAGPGALGFASDGDAALRLQGAGVTAQAEGVATGATFAYRVRDPVSIGRHESAMIPIVQATVPAAPLAWFDPAVLPLHPLAGVRLHNDTGLHLAAGPVSVFDAGGFAGNARLNDVRPGETRLLSYAVDLDVRVLSEDASEPERVTSVALRDGLLETEVRQQLRTRYRLDHGGDGERFVVIEHPKRAGFEVVAPTPAPAETPDAYRFGVRLAPAPTEEGASGDATGATTDPASDPESDSDRREIPTQLVCGPADACLLEVVLERSESRSLALTSAAPDLIAFYLENVELSAADREALARVLELQRALLELDRDLVELQRRVATIHAEQERIRQNMGALDRASSLYGRYLEELQAQEDELAELRAEEDALRQERRGLQVRLDTLLADLAAAGAGDRDQGNSDGNDGNDGEDAGGSDGGTR